MSNPICNLSLDLSNFQNEILSKVGALLNLKGLIGTPPGLLALQGLLAGNLAALQAALGGLLPSIPFADGLISLRDQLGDLASGALGSIDGILDQFGGIVDIDANINLLDLANSAIRFGINFNPCDFASSGIPNIVKNGAGQLINMPNIQPNLGSTDFGQQITLARQTFNNPLTLVDGANQSFTAITNAVDGATALKNNVTGSLTGMGNMLTKLPTGEQVFQTQDAFIDQLKVRTANLVEQNMPKISTTTTGASIQV